MFHTVVYNDPTVAIGAVDASIPIIVGGADNVQNNKYYPPENMDVIWAFAFGTDLSNPRLVTPTLLQLAPHSIYPYNAVDPQVPPFAIDDFNGYPVPIKGLETIDVQVTNLNVAAKAAWVVLGLRTKSDPRPSGPRRRVRFTSTITAVASAWTTGPISLDTDLPVGRYAIVGMAFESATGVAARLSVPGEFYRPGVPANLANGDRYPGNLDMYNWGGFGSFSQNVIPNIEILCQAADVAQTGWLDLIKV